MSKIACAITCTLRSIMSCMSPSFSNSSKEISLSLIRFGSKCLILAILSPKMSSLITGFRLQDRLSLPKVELIRKWFEIKIIHYHSLFDGLSDRWIKIKNHFSVLDYFKTEDW